MEPPAERGPGLPTATHIDLVFASDGAPTTAPHRPHPTSSAGVHGAGAAAGAASATVAPAPSADVAPEPLASSLSSPPTSRSLDERQQQQQQRSNTNDSPSVAVTVLPDPFRKPLPPAVARLHAADEAAGALGGSIKAHYTGSAAKRRSSAASIIRRQHGSLQAALPRPLLGPGDRGPSFFSPDASTGAVVIAADPAPILGGAGANGGGSEDDEDSVLDERQVAQLTDRQASVFDLLEKYGEGQQAKWRQKITLVLDSVWYNLMSVVITAMVLFSDDFRVAVAPPSADRGFRDFTIFCLVFFALELTFSSVAKPRYFLGFYFFIDLVATFSLCFDIPEFMALLIGESSNSLSGSGGATTLAQASSQGQSNLRAARIAQVIRVIRLVRIVKLYTIYAQNRHRIEGTQEMELPKDGEKQSRVGEKLSELTIRKVIIMVLALLFVLPVFEATVGWYGSAPTLDDGGLDLLHTMYGEEGNSTAFQKAAQVYMAETPYRLGSRRTARLIRLFVYNQTLLDSGTADGMRVAEVTSATAQTPGCSTGPPQQCFVSAAFFDTKWYNQVQALLNMGRTSFIILILVTAALLFMRDADRLVLKPLERMMKQVKSVSENPLARSTLPPEELGGRSARKATRSQQLETRILENSISKICSLLSVGFGEAGAEVIADNIRSGGDLNPMIPGRKVTAIFGFCDIRQFTDTTEVLQEEIMEFVNSIAKIVHMEVALHGGAANKNIGDAFLLVWKLPQLAHGGTHSRASSAGIKPRAFMPERQSVEVPALAAQHRQEIAFIADAALASFVVIQAAIMRSAKLRQYSTRTDLNSRIPNFKIRMGFGLHVGWAIEGAIGSEFKIDASYLSPHVNMASRLEAATKQFGTNILLSEDFVRLLSPNVRPLVRQIDRVTVKGSKQPMGLYTYDSSSEGLDLWSTMSAGSKSGKSSPFVPPPPRATGPGRASAATHESYSLASYNDEFREHPDIVMTRAVDPEFMDMFDLGFQAYLSGDWPEAQRRLEECRTFRRNRRGETVVDGPSDTLLTFMAGQAYQAPPDWRGFRELTEK